jgi:glycosyltransferase involved in cell wall biosynthesis
VARRPKPLLLGMGWPSGQTGGLNRYFADLFAALVRAGADPAAVVLGPAPGAPPGATIAAQADTTLPVRLLRYARAARAPADVVDAHFALYALLPALRPRGRPLVVHFQGPWADESRAAGDRSRTRRWAKRRVERTVYRRASRVVTLTGSFKRLLVERYGVMPWCVHVLAPGVDGERFTPGDPLEARTRLDLPADAWVGVCARRLVPRMGIDVLLDAWARLEDDAVLVVAGEGPLRTTLEEHARALGIADRVRFLGRVTDETLVDCYRAADVCVVPSLELEGYGLIVLEAAACGTPSVGTDADGLAEAVGGLGRDLVVPRGDPTALAERLADARTGRRPLPDAAACRAHAERHAWDEVARRHLAVYDAARSGAPPDRIRVVYVGHTARLSGGEIALLRLLPALAEVEAHVVLGEDGPLVARLQQEGISTEVLPLPARVRDVHRDETTARLALVLPALDTLKYTIRLALRLRRLAPDVVHTNSLKAALYGGLAGRAVGIPVVWHIRDRIADDYLPGATVKLVHRLARRLPTGLVANSKTTLATFGASVPRRAVTLPSPVVLSDPIAPAARAASQRAGDEPLRIGMVGRFAPWKGQHVFLAAFARAFPSGDERAIVVGAPLFGEEAYEREVHELAQRLGIAERVDFVGFSEDVARELAEMDVLVHASTLPEPFGQVVVEGLAAGKPVVAAAAGGPTEILAHGVNGLLFEPGDVDALAAALRLLAGDPELRRRLGEAGVERSRDFAPEGIAQRLVGLYREIVRGARR